MLWNVCLMKSKNKDKHGPKSDRLHYHHRSYLLLHFNVVVFFLLVEVLLFAKVLIIEKV